MIAKHASPSRANGVKSRTKTWEPGSSVLHHLVVTAANEKQASAYRLQLDLRQRSGQIGKTTQVHVVPDPGGQRIGSGGSTLVVLKRLLEAMRLQNSIAETFAKQRVLIL